MYNEEPFFVIDESKNDLIELQKEINRLLSKKFVVDDPKAVLLKKFTYELIKATHKLKYQAVVETVSQEIEKPLKRSENLLEQNTEPLIVARDSEIVLVKKYVTSKNNFEIYNVIEPELDDTEKLVLNDLKDTNLRQTSREELMNLIREETKKYNLIFSELFFEKMRYYLIRDIIGYGKIDPLLNDNKLRVINCDGRQIKVQYNNKEMFTNVLFEDNQEINDLIKKIASRNNAKVDESEPVLDIIADFGRIQASLGTQFVNPKFIIRKN